MVLIIGGAYQGKLDHAKAAYGLMDDDIFACESTEIDFSRKCIYKIEAFTYACTQAGIDGIEYFRTHRKHWKDSILICRDISGGVVPMGADLRAWRQMNGQLCRYLAGEAEHVSRIYCGLEQRLK